MNIGETLSVQIIDQLKTQRNQENETKTKTQRFLRQIVFPVIKENDIIEQYENDFKRGLKL